MKVKKSIVINIELQNDEGESLHEEIQELMDMYSSGDCFSPIDEVGFSKEKPVIFSLYVATKYDKQED